MENKETKVQSITTNTTLNSDQCLNNPEELNDEELDEINGGTGSVRVTFTRELKISNPPAPPGVPLPYPN